MLKYRVIFGLLFGALFVALIALDSHLSHHWPDASFSAPPGLFVALGCLVVIPIALREMQKLLASENVIISMRITIVSSLLCMLWPWIEQVSESVMQLHTRIEHSAATNPATQTAELRTLEHTPWYHIALSTRTVKPHYLIPTILAIALVAAIVKHSRHHRVEGAMANAGGTLLAIVYLGVLPGFFLPICMTHSAWMLLAIVCIVKSADIGAYATGHAIGKHKLIPWLSPGKTIEGFFGGLAFSGAVGAAFSLLFFFSWPQGLIAGILLGAVGQLGDLLESLLKRDAGVKDSGTVPGFGGVLDILDSPLLAAPVAYWLLKLI
ncbi:MAG: phosphatidate cytidylyltransferase [Phycisphaerae bacterium]